MGEREGEIGCKIGENTWMGKKREGLHGKSRGAGEVGFLLKEYLCNIRDVIKDTTFDENIWVRVPGERGATCLP